MDCFVEYNSGHRCTVKPEFQVNDRKSCFKHLPQLVKLTASEVRNPVVIVEVLLT